MLIRTTANNILNAMFGRAASAPLAPSCYIGLSSTEPTEQGYNFTEPTAETGYHRALIGAADQPETQKMQAAIEGTITNTVSAIPFNEAAMDWGTLTHFGIFSTETGGVPLFVGELTAPVTVTLGYMPVFAPGALRLTLQ